MIFSSKLHSTFLRNLNRCLNLSFQIKFAYGNTNKPLNSFSSKQSKFPDRNVFQNNQNNKLIDQSQQNDTIKKQVTVQDEQVKSIQRRNNKVTQKQNKEVSFFFDLNEKQKLDLILEYKQKQMLKQISLIARQMSYMNQKSQVVWAAIQQVFVQSLIPTQDQTRIRQYSALIYALSKSKKATRNYQTPMALVLPFSSPKSFTQIVTSISRMGGLSQQFCHIIQKLYYKKRQQLSALQANLVNYSLVKNGKKIDTTLIQHLNSFPLRGICIMLKSYDRCNLLSAEILKKCIPAILARKQQTNFFDLKHLINVYTKHMYLDDQRIVNFFDQQYRILSRNINEQTIEDIWQYIPQAMNSNKLPISFMQNLIKSLKILKSRQRISQRTWKKISQTFSKFQNLQLRTKLEKIF